MREWLASVGVRLVLCLLASGVAFVVIGPIGAVFTIPLYGVAFAKLVWELIAGFLYASKWAALRDVQGRDFMHRGIRIDVLAHSDNFRWLSTADVRKVLPAFPGDMSLLNMYPADIMAADGQRGGAHPGGEAARDAAQVPQPRRHQISQLAGEGGHFSGPSRAGVTAASLRSLHGGREEQKNGKSRKLRNPWHFCVDIPCNMKSPNLPWVASKFIVSCRIPSTRQIPATVQAIRRYP